MACYCCVLGCKSNNHKSTVKHFFRFPKNDVKRRKLWKKFARKSTNFTSVICEDHFETRFMMQKDKKLKLTNDAIPTMFSKITKEGKAVKVKVEFDGEDYYGDEAEEMIRAIAKTEDQEIVALETAFINEQNKLDELRSSCRFCAEMKNELIDLSSFATFNVNLNDFLQSLGLTISESDFFPNSVCEECFNQVLVINTFIIKCKAADQLLWDEIGKLKTLTTVDASPNKSSEAIREEHVIDLGSEFYEEIEPNFTDNITETYAEEILEEELIDDQGSKMFTESSETNCEFKNPDIDVPTMNSSSTKLLETTIMDPSCNKFAKKTYDCEICLKTFAGLKTYKAHVCDVPEIRCPVCGDIFATGFALKSHYRHLHSEKQKKNYCPICQTVITGSSIAFTKHKAKCNRNRAEKFQCETCTKAFSSLHGYTVHQMFHESKKKSEEDVFDPKNLKRKEKKRPGVICELCGKTYTTVGDCRRHIKLKHTELTEVFSCHICNKNYPSKSVLKDHFRNTHVVAEVACTFCGKVFRNKTHLKKHMVYHDESKKVHKCLKCPEQPGFINKVGLLRHQSRHANSDDKFDYNCDICINYNFHTSSQLKSHLKHVHGVHGIDQ